MIGLQVVVWAALTVPRMSPPALTVAKAIRLPIAANAPVMNVRTWIVSNLATVGPAILALGWITVPATLETATVSIIQLNVIDTRNQCIERQQILGVPLFSHLQCI